MIIYSAMLLSDQYRISWTIKPVFDAFTALVLDLSMDAIAIRLGFWNWGIPFNQEWYGVPFANLFGWIAVVFTFSFIIRFIRTLNPKRFLKMTVADTGIVSILEEELGVPCKMVSNGQTYKDLEKYNE